jgi:hypothetical protein
MSRITLKILVKPGAYLSTSNTHITGFELIIRKDCFSTDIRLKEQL